MKMNKEILLLIKSKHKTRVKKM